MKVKSVALLMIGLIAAGTHAGWALGEAGAVQSGAYHSAQPVAEQVTYNDSKTGFYREIVAVPPDYGKLITINSHECTATLCFESSDGSIRNLVVDDSQLLLILRKGNLTRP